VKGHLVAVSGVLALLLTGCSALVNSGGGNPPPPLSQLTVTPASATVRGSNTQSFAAQRMGAAVAVNWSVNGVTGGNAANGMISAAGLYTAPEFPPASNAVTIGAVDTSDSTKTASSAVTLENPIPQIMTATPVTIQVGAFNLAVNGVHFANGATIYFGTTALATTRVSSTQLTASGTATTAQVGSISITVKNPDPGAVSSGGLLAQIVNNNGTPVSPAAAVRFLEQSSFGPTTEQVNQLQQVGFDSLLQGQFAAPGSVYPAPAPTDMGLGKVQQQFFSNAVNNPDQLRQRLAFALNEIWVVGENKVSDPTGYTNYIQALTNDGLGNYYSVMKDVTLTAAMGHWLDMVNNDKPGTGQHANENYARELMQLFTLGLNQLNPDGTPVLDSTGNPVPTYTQDDVMALGRALTGWTYPTQPGQTLQKHNPEYYGGPMLPFESNHDAGAKTLLGQSVAAGQSAEQELDSVLTIIFNHPNMPPFVGKQLIEKLVTSNPSPAYVQRVAQAFASGKFNSYGSGKRGDMQATVAAILLDAEARRGDSATTTDPKDGKLREPVIMMVSMARAFHATSDGSGFQSRGASMSEDIFNSGSVFNFFPPDNLIPQTALNGPEFAIFNTNTSLSRVNFINSIVYAQISSNTKLDFSPVVQAGTPDQMVAWLNNLLLHGTMSNSTKQSILTAIGAIATATPPSTGDLTSQAKAAIYLVASSSQYQVER
jgi:uncharacterized protein (DUF1800 family)